MATPTIVVPFERILRTGEDGELYVDERRLGPELSKAVDNELGNTQFRQSRFFPSADWRFHQCRYDGQNLGGRLPRSAIDALNDGASRDNVAAMATRKWIGCLRNALAHGGVMYLDEDGRQVDDQPAATLAMVSTSYKKDRLRIVRVSERGFLRFVVEWVGWLEESGLSNDYTMAS
jgi:hypothetical protein